MPSMLHARPGRSDDPVCLSVLVPLSLQVQAEDCAIRVFRFATDLLRITRVVSVLLP